MSKKTILDYFIFIMNRGYSRKVSKRLPIILNKEKEPDLEKQLWQEVQKIDQILKSDNLTTMHGFIFTDQFKNRLAQDLLNAINKNHRLLVYGLQLQRKHVMLGVKETMPVLVNPEQSFKKKLEEISAQKIKRFDQEKIRHFSQLDHITWKPNVYSTQNTHKKVIPLNLSTSIHKIEDNSSHIKDTQTQGPVKLKRNKTIGKKVYTQPAQLSCQRDVNVQHIEKVLKDVRGKIVTIWLPPKSYPQFYGLIVPSLTINKSSEIVRCRIKKYVLFKQSISARLFEAILDYLSSIFEIYIEKFELIVSREDYRSYYEKIGCKIQSWQGFEKVAITYSRQFNL